MQAAALLQQQFPEAAREALVAEKRAGADGVAGLWANFQSLVTIRKAGDVPGDTPAAIVCVECEDVSTRPRPSAGARPLAMMSLSCCVGQEASDQLQKAESDAETHAIVANSTVIRAATAIVLLAPERAPQITPRIHTSLSCFSSLEIASAK